MGLQCSAVANAVAQKRSGGLAWFIQCKIAIEIEPDRRICWVIR